MRRQPTQVLTVDFPQSKSNSGQRQNNRQVQINTQNEIIPPSEASTNECLDPTRRIRHRLSILAELQINIVCSTAKPNGAALVLATIWSISLRADAYSIYSTLEPNLGTVNPQCDWSMRRNERSELLSENIHTKGEEHAL
jgi:hypothetical protein